MRDLCRDPFFVFPFSPGKGFNKPLHGHLTVLELGAAFRCLSNYAGRKVTYPHRGIGNIPVLPSWAGTTIKLDLQIRKFDFFSHLLPVLYAVTLFIDI